MIYQEFQPHPHWQAFVSTYWYACGEECGSSRIYPDGYVDLIFHMPGPALISVSGMMTAFRDVALVGRMEFLGIRLKPSAVSLLKDIPVGALRNLSLSLSEVSAWPVREWNEKLWTIPDLKGRIHWIERDLLPELLQDRSKPAPLIPAICRYLSAHYTHVDISALAKQHYISLRQLERRFKSCMGVSMKEYQRVLRFSNALLDIHQLPQMSLLQIAFNHGYTDHAHLTREVQRMTGRNPSALRLSL
ncbi:MAG: helix-turn-helix transcriptional regulator [Saprospiraceae bacterium]|nr:helix-turn-helix transcriptional regulator [Saprospiraceae bacterium]